MRRLRARLDTTISLSRNDIEAIVGACGNLDSLMDGRTDDELGRALALPLAVLRKIERKAVQASRPLTEAE